MSQTPSVAACNVESTMNYIKDTGERPANYLYETEPGYTPPPPAAEKRRVTFIDARPAMADFTLDANGFTFLRQPLPRLDFLDPQAVEHKYYPACCELVRHATAATEVIAFDHNVRDKGLAGAPDSKIREPVRFAHNDYTEVSGPQRLRDLMGDRAESLLRNRYLFINVWRPLRGPVLDVPLAVCDAGSLETDDFVATDLIYADRRGEVYSVRHRDGQRWYYLNRMQDDELLLLKCFDSARDGRARYTAHAAFRAPDAPADALPRRSIEVRTVALFAPD